VLLREFPELPLHVFEAPPDPIIEEAILDAAADWWRFFDAGAIAPAAELPPLGDWDRAPPPPPTPQPRTQSADIAALFGLAAQRWRQ
jgi:hypothetical protein